MCNLIYRKRLTSRREQSFEKEFYNQYHNYLVIYLGAYFHFGAYKNVLHQE